MNTIEEIEACSRALTCTIAFAPPGLIEHYFQLSPGLHTVVPPGLRTLNTYQSILI